ncbi:MAG TPA: MucB/RseB C-terminal domain-containing protein [Steroidobacteraceae bacterium]|nr:MucB/RseB C-terminal domain-containing protein [Steroidobacteraceae bacterium]
MRPARLSEQLTWLALALAVAGVACADEPQKWLERMNQALTTLNYDGVFWHWQGGRAETLRIIHRVENGVVTERLVSLDGSGREFIRTGSRLVCYLPDERKVLVERQPDASLVLGTLPKFTVATNQFYAMKALMRTRLLGKKTQLIAVDPKDQYRYGYRLWIDEATGMPLRTELRDARGRVIEQLVFASIATPAHIPDSAFKPDVSTTGFQWLREAPATLSANPAAVVTWSALRLPPGFHISLRAAQVMPGYKGPVEHLVYTDGIASVSVFVESHLHPDHVLSGSAQVGTSSAFSTIVDGHPVTAVGEVPPETVRFIANSVKAEPVSASPSVPPALVPLH